MTTLRALVVAAVLLGTFLGVPSHAMPKQGLPTSRQAAVDVVQSVARGDEVRRTVALPWRANLIGITFDGAADPGVELAVRTRAGDGPWSGWTHLEVEPDEAPDAWEATQASSRVATEPLWVGRANRVDLRIVSEPRAAPIRSVKIVALNTNGDAEDVAWPIALVRSVGRILGATAAPPRAHAAPRAPRIITRAEWGADESWRDGSPRYASALHLAFVHHTAGTNSYTKSQSAAIVRAIYRYHTQTRGWSDIGYNFLVDRYGQIFEGRYGGIDRAVIGAHAGGFNTGSTGVSLMGTFTSTSPSSSMISALQNLLAWKLDQHHVPPVGRVRMISGGSTRYSAGTAVWLHRISGHRDVSATGCPGDRVYGRLSGVRDAVNRIGGTKIYLPRVPESIRFPGVDGEGPLRATATFNRTVSWTFAIRDGAGSAVFSATGRGTSMATEWDGHGPGGSLVPSGIYDWRLEAVGVTDGNVATPADGPIAVDNEFQPPFYDDDGSAHEPNINEIAEREITRGCATERFCPHDPVLRGQMASFLARALDLPEASKDYFTDDDRSGHEDAINRVAEAGITVGCAPQRFCPLETVLRAQMAAFLARALDLPPALQDHFTDDDGLEHEDAINRIAQAGITTGCAPSRFCPGDVVLRAHMASFLARALTP